ncbi:hypothetical protein OF83DRAFT_1167926 [Amylostereum chailletii]|nr:hypothetical protein OF83DRAFT_1167926 [Amylostereum chailletii]
MAPRELPGFYFDEVKNRYFPLSSKPKSPLHTTLTSNSVNSSKESLKKRPRRREDEMSRVGSIAAADVVQRHSAWRASEAVRSAPSGRRRRGENTDFLASQITSTSACQSVTLSGWSKATISALGIASVGGRVRALAGNNDGGLYRFEIPEPSYVHLDARTVNDSWIGDVHLGSRISSICHSDSHWVVTSFGPQPHMYVQGMHPSRLSSDKQLRDVWTSDLRRRSLAIGMHRGLWLTQDISKPNLITKHSLESDVFAIHQEENLIYSGLRNGAVLLTDTRVSLPRMKTSLLGEAFVANSSSIVYLNRVHEHELLVSTIRGTIEVFDLRYSLINRPVIALQGHANAYRSDLPHALTPSHDFLFAAGLDNRIRAWCLRTGVLLCPSAATLTQTSTPALTSPADHALNPFSTTFSEPVTALSVVEVDASKDMFLFAAAGHDIHRFTLGGKYFDKTGAEGWWDCG